MMVTLSFLLPAPGPSACRRPPPAAAAQAAVEGTVSTLDRVGLGQLGQVGQQLLRDVVPGLALAQPQVDVCAGQLVGVELPAAGGLCKCGLVTGVTGPLLDRDISYPTRSDQEVKCENEIQDGLRRSDKQLTRHLPPSHT